MNARDYLGAIRKRRLLVIAFLLLGAAGGYAYSKAQTPLYGCKLAFYVGTPALNGQDANSTNQFAQDRAASYAALLSSDALAGRIVHRYHVALPPRQLANEITASAQLNTILIDVTITDASRARATRIGKAVGTLFPVLVDDLDNAARQGGSAVSLSVVSGPHTSSAPVSPLTRTNVALGIALGLLLGVGLAIGRELMDVSVRDAGSAVEATGAPLLASIAYDSNVGSQPLIVQDTTYSPRAESLRQLRTNLQFIDATHPARALVVTSAVAAEGKSLVSVNLSLVMAEAGRRVLLVEADLRKPCVSELLGLDGTVGLSTILAGRAEFEDAVQPWGYSNLDVLSSGTLPPNPSELLDGPRMKRLIDIVKDRYEVVVIDATPLLPVTDAAVIAALADGAILVVKHGRTRRGQLRSAVAALDAVHARLLGVVLNMTALSRYERRGYAAYYKGAAPAGRRVSRRRRRKAQARTVPGHEWVTIGGSTTKSGRGTESDAPSDKAMGKRSAKPAKAGGSGEPPQSGERFVPGQPPVHEAGHPPNSR